MTKQSNNESTHFIKKIKFFKKFRCFKKDETYDFKAGINLLVGDQGSGKSSLFYSILNWQESGIAMKYDDTKGYVFLDTEKMNPRLDDSFKAHREFQGISDYDKAKFNSVANRLANDLGVKSHGEVILPFVKSTETEKDKTIFIDEPEAGLSIRSQYKLVDYFQKLAKHNQLIIATHSIILIRSMGDVLSLEHKKWMDAEEFIKTQEK